MSTHLTQRWAALTKQASSSPTMWHVTDSPGFTLDPNHRPRGDGGYTHAAGLFVTPNPELWLYLWRYSPGKAMYAVQVDGPCQRMGHASDDRDQWFVPADRLDDVKIKMLVPIEQAIAQARRDGFGFAMLMADAFGSPIHVVDHRKGWGSAETLCGGAGDGTPLKWTTKDWVLTGPMATKTCPDCLAKLKRQRS